MERKEKLNRIFLILLSLFVVMLGYGMVLLHLLGHLVKGNIEKSLTW